MIKAKGYIDFTEKTVNCKKDYDYIIFDANYFIDNNGIKHFVDGKKVVLDYSEKELEIAKWLGKTFGGKIYMLPKINIPEGIKTADYLFKNELWDLKEINSSGKRVIDNRINGNKRQAKNYIFDITKTKLTNEAVLKQIENIYKSNDRLWIDKIIVKKYNYVLAVYKRK